jgi:protein PhnA
MTDAMTCPQCRSEHVYRDAALWVCPECSHEWSADGSAAAESADDAVIRDANGVVVIKDLKVKGVSSVIKGGTKVRNIRLQEASDGHDIACKIDGIGQLNLKSEFVRKA